jgi:hypothetical protein
MPAQTIDEPFGFESPWSVEKIGLTLGLWDWLLVASLRWRREGLRANARSNNRRTLWVRIPLERGKNRINVRALGLAISGQLALAERGPAGECPLKQ